MCPKLVPSGGTGPETKDTSWLGRFSVTGAIETSHAPVPKYAVLRPGLSTPLSVTSAPRALRLAMSPRDLVAFAKMHLDGGTGPDGGTVLSDASVKAMQERQVELPDLGL